MGFEIIPRVAQIENITKGQTTVVEFTQDHLFVLGEIVSFRVTKPYGMTNINNMQGLVIDTTSDTITVNIDSLGFLDFVIPGDTHKTTPPQCVPSASGIAPNVVIPTVTLQDAFDNIRT